MKQKSKGTLTPKLRFPEFCRAPGWETVALGQLLLRRPEYGINAPAVVFSEQLPTYLRITDIDDDGRFISTGKVSVGVEVSKENYLSEGDIVLARTGASVGKSYRYRASDGRLVFAGFLIRVRPDGNKLVPIFLANYLTTRQYWEWVRATSSRSGQPGINGGEYASLPVPMPLSDAEHDGAPEQQKIADCLTSLDELIAAEGRMLEALKAHKKGLMQQLFPQPGETKPRLRFPEFRDKGEWERFPLSKYVSSLDAGVSVRSGDRPAGSNEVGILKTSAVTDGVFSPQENKVVLEKDELQRVKESVSENSIIISRMNTPALVGANAYVKNSLDNIFLPDRLWAAKPRRNTSMRFIAFVLGSVNGRAALCELATGTSGSMKNVTKPDVLALEITAPSFAEQEKIATCLTSVDDLLAAQTKKIDALQTQKKGLMQQLFPALEDNQTNNQD